MNKICLDLILQSIYNPLNMRKSLFGGDTRDHSTGIGQPYKQTIRQKGTATNLINVWRTFLSCRTCLSTWFSVSSSTVCHPLNRRYLKVYVVILKKLLSHSPFKQVVVDFQHVLKLVSITLISMSLTEREILSNNSHASPSI